jgi:hypothetical protein
MFFFNLRHYYMHFFRCLQHVSMIFVHQSGQNMWLHIFNMRSFTLTMNDHNPITVASLGYVKTVGRSPYSKRQQCQRYVFANKQCTPIFFGFFPKSMLTEFQEHTVFPSKVSVCQHFCDMVCT